MKLAADQQHQEVAELIEKWWNDQLLANVNAGNVDRLREMIKVRPLQQPTTEPASGQTLLAAAVAATPPSTEVVKLLVECDPASTTIADAKGYTPLWSAARAGNVEILDALASESDATKLDSTIASGERLLNVAVQGRNPDAVTLLVKQYKLDPNGADTKGITPLRLAAQAHDAAMIRKLIELGAQLSVQTLSDVKTSPPMDDQAKDAASAVATPLLLAVAQSAPADQIVTILDSASVCGVVLQDLVDCTNGQGCTPLQLAASNPKQMEVVKLLLDRGASIDKKNPTTGDTALHVAARAGCDDIVAELLRRSADDTISNSQERTARDEAQQSGQTAIAKRLDDWDQRAYSWFNSIQNKKGRLTLAGIGTIDLSGNLFSDGIRPSSISCRPNGDLDLTTKDQPLPGNLPNRHTQAVVSILGAVVIQNGQPLLVHFYHYTGKIMAKPDGAFEWVIGNEHIALSAN